MPLPPPPLHSTRVIVFLIVRRFQIVPTPNKNKYSISYLTMISFSETKHSACVSGKLSSGECCTGSVFPPSRNTSVWKSGQQYHPSHEPPEYTSFHLEHRISVYTFWKITSNSPFIGTGSRMHWTGLRNWKGEFKKKSSSQRFKGYVPAGFQHFYYTCSMK